MPDDRSIGNDKTVSPDDAGSQSSAALNPGDSLGQYKIIRLLGRGGMGEVYEVEHKTLERRYALKLLPAEFVSRPDAVSRFRREAKVMANLDHPNILSVDEFGETDGRYWLRMELAEGGKVKDKHVCSLAEYVEASGGNLSPDEAQAIFIQILEGLAHAHEHGVIHRDLKPANILIFSDADGNATFKISDFGLVRMVGEEWVRSQADQSIRLSMSMGNMATEAPEAAGSSTRSMIGTYEYMSPEQKRGEEATAASDVYAVGLMMYRLLTGRQLGPRPPSYYMPELESIWDEVILTALEENTEQRFSDASSMLLNLNGIKQKTLLDLRRDLIRMLRNIKQIKIKSEDKVTAEKAYTKSVADKRGEKSIREEDVGENTSHKVVGATSVGCIGCSLGLGSVVLVGLPLGAIIGTVIGGEPGGMIGGIIGAVISWKIGVWIGRYAEGPENKNPLT